MAERLASTKLPRGIVHYRQDAEAWLRSCGRLDHGLPPPSGSGPAPRRRVLHSTPNRENAVLDSGPRGTAVFEKLTRSLTLSALQKACARACGFTTPLLHEWDMLWRARERGVRVPEPVAAGTERGFLLPRSDFLITETLPGTCLFSVLEHELDAIPEAGRFELAAAVGRAVAGLHASGITFPDLYAKHVWLDRGEGGWLVGFLDLTSARYRPKIARRDRARDLGVLAGSLPFRAPLPLLLHGLRAYVAASEGLALRETWTESGAYAADLQRLRRFRRGIAPRGPRGMAPRADRPHEAWVVADLFRRFGVPAEDAPGAAVPIDDGIVEPLRRLLLATFRAGVLPMGDVLPHLRRAAAGEIVWDARAPLRAPRKSREIVARWRVFFLRREIARSALSPAAKKSLAGWLGGEPVAAFALTRL